MKAFIVAMFVLVGVGIASVSYAGGQKEPTYPPYCWQQPTGSELWYPCGDEGAKVAHCATLMETAMVKIDPYLQFVEPGITNFPPEEKDKFTKALYAWNRIKHECWKEYEQERLEGSHIH